MTGWTDRLRLVGLTDCDWLDWLVETDWLRLVGIDVTGWTGQVVVTGWTDDWLGLVGLFGGGVHLLLPRAGPGLTARSCLIFMIVV